MSKKDTIISELDRLPEKVLDDVLDYINFLKGKIIKEKIDITLNSESSLKKDWFRPEEDNAWQDL